MSERQEPVEGRTGEKNLRPSHFTCDHCNSLIWVEEKEEFPECANCGESTFHSREKH